VSELIENGAGAPKDLLKHLILQLHDGAAPAQVQRQLVRLLGQVPYGLVVEVEQELIEDGLPPEEVTRLCHLHGAALEGAIDHSGARTAPPGHPVHTFQQENAALRLALSGLEHAARKLEQLPEGAPAGDALLPVRARVAELADVDKHYLRKEHLLFPYLEKHGITAPPKVMWGKHDEARGLLRAAHEALAARPATIGAAKAAVADAVWPAARAIADMISREENILLPMSLDTLEEGEWWEIARQGDDYGYCLVEPADGWRPASVPADAAPSADGARVRLPTGSFTVRELEAILNALPLDATFVDAEDRVRYFTAGKERVFARSRAVLGRRVQHCHPPSSVDTVERILDGFRAGSHDRAAFWIELRGRFVHIEYVALRDSAGKYLGCLEVTQDLTEKRALTGQQRLLSWGEKAAAPRAAEAAEQHAPCAAQGAAPRAPATDEVDRPEWASDAALTFDARPALAAGEHPKQRVMSDLAALAHGGAYLLLTPFVPTPLVELARGGGFETFSLAGGDGVVRTWFRRGAASPAPEDAC
jgi:DUF438 domain-containing protein